MTPTLNAVTFDALTARELTVDPKNGTAELQVVTPDGPLTIKTYSEATMHTLDASPATFQFKLSDGAKAWLE